jgi:hypothetical protein
MTTKPASPLRGDESEYAAQEEFRIGRRLRLCAA